MHIVTATAPGAGHVKAGQPGKINNQDALLSLAYPRGHITVLCDGCGSQPYSGTGADIGASLIAKAIREHLEIVSAEELNWNEVSSDISKALAKIVNVMTAEKTNEAIQKTIIERFLFTAMVLIVDEESVVIASFGDGVVIIDDEILVLEAPIANSPQYMGYLLLTNTTYHKDEYKEFLKFSVVRSIKKADITKGIIVGTDGLKDLINEDLHHPTLVQPKALQRWLNILSTEKIEDGSFRPGKCQDDVTLVVFRTEESQKNLFEGRKEIAELKQRLIKLQTDVETTAGILNRTTISYQAAKEKVENLEEQLEVANEQATKAVKFKSEIVALQEKIGDMRESLDPKDSFVQTVINGIEEIVTIFRPPAKAEPSVPPKISVLTPQKINVVPVKPLKHAHYNKKYK